MPKYFGFQGCGVLLYDKECKLKKILNIFIIANFFFTEPTIVTEDSADEKTPGVEITLEESQDEEEQFIRMPTKKMDVNDAVECAKLLAE